MCKTLRRSDHSFPLNVIIAFSFAERHFIWLTYLMITNCYSRYCNICLADINTMVLSWRWAFSWVVIGVVSTKMCSLWGRKISEMIWECFFMYGKCFNRQPAFETMVDHAAICLDSLLSGSLADSDNQDLLLAELKDIVVKKTKWCSISRKWLKAITNRIEFCVNLMHARVRNTKSCSSRGSWRRRWYRLDYCTSSAV